MKTATLHAFDGTFVADVDLDGFGFPGIVTHAGNDYVFRQPKRRAFTMAAVDSAQRADYDQAVAVAA